MGQHGAADHGGHHHFILLGRRACPGRIFSPTVSLDGTSNKTTSRCRSCAGLTRASIFFARRFYEDGWIAGSSPAMTSFAGGASQGKQKQVRFAELQFAPSHPAARPIEETRMVEVPITIACGNYDRTRAIKDGRVKVEGCAVTYLPLYPEEIFFRAFRYQEFDVSEL